MLSLTEEALGGLSAGIIGTVIGYPLDVVKTHMQTSSSAASNSHSPSVSMRHVATRLVQTHGLRGLYRGVAPPLVSLSILNTLNFSSYSYVQSTLHGVRGAWDWRNAVAAAMVGPIASNVSTVENLIKTQMQMHHRATSSWQCVRQLVAARQTATGNAMTAWSILYTGHVINTIRETTFLLTYFYMYEGLRTELARASRRTTLASSSSSSSSWHDDAHETTTWAIPVAGGLAGATAWAVSFPLDCVRATIQGRDLLLLQPRPTPSSSPSSTNHSEARIGPVVRQLLATKGVRGLYAGVTPSLVRAFVVSGTRFSAYETTLWLIRGGRDMSHT